MEEKLPTPQEILSALRGVIELTSHHVDDMRWNAQKAWKDYEEQEYKWRLMFEKLEEDNANNVETP